MRTPFGRTSGKKRRAGQSVTHMSVLVSAYYRAVLRNPKLNYFVMNSRIYKRNHFCFSFVILKTRADGTPDETSPEGVPPAGGHGVHRDGEDSGGHRKEPERPAQQRYRQIREVHFRRTGAGRTVIGLAGFLDRHNLLPRSIIELSPFHTSLFVTNLASINTPYIFHHCYEFGTTSVFICMGRPVHDPAVPEGVRKR